MDISIYAIKVGKSSIDQLNFNNEFDIQTTTKDNPSYSRKTSSTTENNKDTSKLLDVYDVLLAGVEVNDW